MCMVHDSVETEKLIAKVKRSKKPFYAYKIVNKNTHGEYVPYFQSSTPYKNNRIDPYYNPDITYTHGYRIYQGLYHFFESLDVAKHLYMNISLTGKYNCDSSIRIIKCKILPKDIISKGHFINFWWDFFDSVEWAIGAKKFTIVEEVK